tara:strand:- start:32957 stop:34525 length:1569 start_codon:yes stop_codon:yes gene_type:complete
MAPLSTSDSIDQKTTENRLNNYLHHFPGIFFEQEADLSLSFVSPCLKTLLGVPPDSILHDTHAFMSLIHEEDHHTFIKQLHSGTEANTTFGLNYRLRHPITGNIFYILDVRTPNRSKEGTLLGYSGVWVDKTRQVIAENHLAQSAWKESLAILTRGLVHDFSNIMAGIFSLSELYHTNMSKDDPMYTGMAQIKNNALEAQKLVRRILDLNKGNLGNKEYHNIESLIQEQIDLLRIILPKHTALETRFTNQELPVYIDGLAFRQVLLNLGMNARDALGPDASVFIETRAVDAGDTILEGTINRGHKAPKPGVEICFSDNGSGISQEHLSKIFSPHFSTKDVGKGSGFGLYNAQLFMENHQGKISVKSSLERGTTFALYLPLAEFSTENNPTNLQEKEYENKSRPHCLVYSSQDPSTFEIFSLLQEQGWEIIAFSESTAIDSYLQETPSCPDILLAIDLGQDSEIPSLLESFREHCPNTFICLRVLGRNPDELRPQFKKKVDRLFDESIMDVDLVQQLASLISA